MASFLSPGVFIEEVANAPQTVEAVSTSTMAVVGWTLQGPTDEATLVTGPDSFVRQFGGYTNQSLVPITVSAFFQNGGTRCYVVRVVPSDAVAATSSIGSEVTGEAVGGTMAGGTPVTVTDTLLYPPATAGSVTVRWTKAGTAIASQNIVFTPAENGALLGPFTGTLGSVPITNDTVTIDWQEGAASRTATLNSAGVIGGANAADLSAVTLNRTTGAISITFASGNPPDADSIRLSYTPVGAADSATDVSGTFTDTGLVGTINYTTGAISLTFTGATVVPYNGSTVTVDYTGQVWGLAAASKGLWGNDIRVTLAGNENFFIYGPATTTGAGTYSKFDVTVLQKNASDVYEIKETYEEVVLDDPTDAMYLADVINEGSDLVTITDTGFEDAPATFIGNSITAESIATGNGTTTAYTHTCATPTNTGIVKTSAVIRYTTGAVARTATANASGTITGTHIDSTKTNTINWSTGAITLNFSTAPDNTTAITVDYIEVPETTTINYDFTGGADGDVAGIANTNVSNYAALKSGKLGMYALDRIDENMQLVIPDFAGNTTVQGDMLDYAETRRDLFCILTTPSGMSAQEAVDYQRITLNKKSKYGAMYWPWVKVADPEAATRTLLVPPVGHIAGIYARTDNSKNVGKAPGGTVDGALRGVVGLELSPGKEERDVVAPARINALINTPQTGMCVWGVRTMSATNDAFKYINAVRLFSFVEKSVFNSTHNYVFESINVNLYTNIRAQLNSFLLNLHNQGYFAGTTAAQSFIVKCDADNNPPEVQEQGQVVCDVAIAPNKPAEFIRFRLAQKTIS